MEDQLKNILKQITSKFYSMGDADFAALFDAEGKLKTDAFDVISKKDKERVGSFKGEHDDKFNQGYNKAKKESLSKFEEDFKKEFEFDSDLQGLELVKDFVKKQVSAKQITDEQVKGHASYKALELAHQKQVEKINKEHEEKFSAREVEIKREKVLAHVKKVALQELETLNPVLPEEAALKQNQLRWFEKDLESGKYDVKEKSDGTLQIIPLNEKGERLEDEHANPIQFADHIKRLATGYWPLSKEKKRTIDPAKNGQQNTATPQNGKEQTWASKITLTKPANDKDFEAKAADIYSNKNLTPQEKDQAALRLTELHTGTEA